MFISGRIEDGQLVITDAEDGVPVVLADEPEPVEGYEAVPRWVEEDGAIRQTWALHPTAEAVAKASIEAQRLTATMFNDREALAVAALFPAWEPGGSYADGERVNYGGRLYRATGGQDAGDATAPDAEDAPFVEIEGR